MKFNNKCVKSMCMFLVLCITGLFAASCMQESAYSELLTDEYPELYRHVFDRNADSLLGYTEHPDSYIRDQAWRALVSTPVKNMNDFITKAQYANSDLGWMALSAHELTDEQLTRLHSLWNRRASMRNGISMVLGQQGNQESLDLLTQNFDEIIGPDSDYEYSSALAMGRLMMNYKIPESSRRSILRYAAVLEDVDLYRAYFYGLFRGEQVIEDEQIRKNIWEAYEWVESPYIRQYALRISFKSDAEWTFERLPLDDVSEMNVQLAVELANQISNVGWSEKLEEAYSLLLNHSNPVVNEVALNRLAGHAEKPSTFDEVVVAKIIENEDKEASVRLSGIMALSNVEDYLDITESLSGDQEYLLIKKLNIYQKALEADSYIAKLQEYAGSANRMEALFAAQALSGWWGSIDKAQQTSSRKENVREIALGFLERGDRSITYVIASLLESSDLILDEDFSRIEDLLTNYQLPEDIEVYQSMAGFLYERFQSEAQPLIDSLAAKGNPALNSTLASQGWDVPDTEAEPPVFRRPNWERLAALDYEPVWVLETQEGIIKIAMDVLSAPATISGIDSLTRAGAYDSIAFHRVVPNFVIQGGDVETGDGFGGPDYVVPTESSGKEYYRGMVGIASAGTDTEGSQYFVMHDWAPHLNGRYTIIGEVVEGMEVVDRIMVGDKVLKAYWQNGD
ncbi:peptidylprolyl isomerase [Gracilimonas sp.]|uniref:peptidylprolyl isomerase n=1 Tax=Gracilimonas sp. TaxID=1974203 RepID=UPI0032F003EC